MSGILIVGAGGHARVLIDVLRSCDLAPTGLVDPNLPPNESVLGVQILGDDAWLDAQNRSDHRLVIGIGATGLPTTRVRLFNDLSDKGHTIIGASHASTLRGSNCNIDNTAQILPGCAVNNSTQIDANVVVYTGSIIEHDCIVGAHTYLSPRVTLCGGVTIGERSFIGAAATILPGIHVGSDVVVGAGAVVTRDVVDGSTVMGIPAKVVDSSQ